ncbi:hypothetical protein IFR05_001551 [Cadophora sp. M221]|nr:hypothetical protein IFR05_001551 [Cadophora sp. M221]
MANAKPPSRPPTSQDLFFTLFPLLPKELRLEIWKRALPPPRLIEFRFTDTASPDRVLLGGLDCHGEWAWVASTEPVALSLLLVNTEARDVTSKSYELVGIRNQCQAVGDCMHIDFSRDTIYLARYSQERLLDVLSGRFANIQHTHVWLSKTRSLAMNLGSLSKGPWTWAPPTYPGVKRLSRPDGLQDASTFFVKIFGMFPMLKDFRIVIDGRNPDLGGSVEIAQPSSDHEDFYDPSGREVALRWIPGALDHVKTTFPDLHLPHVCLALLTNGNNSEALERRWDYLHACCRFSEPGFDGHRWESESDESAWADSP